MTERRLHLRSDDNFQTKSVQCRLVPLSEVRKIHLLAFYGTNAFILDGAYTSRYRVHPDRVGLVIRRAVLMGEIDGFLRFGATIFLQLVGYSKKGLF